MEAASTRLAGFVEEMPLARRPILQFLRGAASELPAGSRVLDAGAGDQPYRELFSHCEYIASDWAGALYRADLKADIVGPLHDLPVPDASFDGVLCSQVLEHVPNPAESLRELHRVLRPGGKLWLAAPFVWPLHEQPYDFFRYSNHGLETLLRDAGFSAITIEAETGYFSTLAVLLTGAPAALEWGWTVPEKILRRTIAIAGRLLPRLDRYDQVGTFPIGFVCAAVKPDAG